MRRRVLAGMAALAALAGGLGIASCGSDQPAGGGAPGGPVLDIYSSLPLSGPQSAHAAAIVDGIRLAIDQAGGGVADYQLVYRSLDDTLPQSSTWAPGQTARNAAQALEDPHGTLYIGDFDSGASAVSIPILNRVGIPQISPASTYSGLTTAGAGAAPGEPQRYYPAGRRSFVRLVPRDSVQASALISLMRGDRCRAVAIAEDGTIEGEGLTRLVQAEAASAGVAVVDAVRAPGAVGPYARRLRAARADCVLYAGGAAPGVRALFDAVGAALPRARLYATDELCDTGFATAEGGLDASATRRFRCTSPVLAVRAYPGGQSFAAAFRRAYSRPVSDGYALVGYETMRLTIDTIASLGADIGSRDALLTALLRVHGRPSPLGTYSITGNGDTTLERYGVYRLGRDGQPVYERAIGPGRG